jgi:hypothetical protein
VNVNTKKRTSCLPWGEAPTPWHEQQKKPMSDNKENRKRKREDDDDIDDAKAKKPKTLDLLLEWQQLCVELDDKRKIKEDTGLQVKALMQQLGELQATQHLQNMSLQENEAKETKMKLQLVAGGQAIMCVLLPLGVHTDVINIIAQYASSIQGTIAWMTRHLDDFDNESQMDYIKSRRHRSMCVVGDEVVIADTSGFVGVMPTCLVAAPSGGNDMWLRKRQEAFDISNKTLWVKAGRNHIYVLSESERRAHMLDRRTLEPSTTTAVKDFLFLHVDLLDELWVKEKLNLLVNYSSLPNRKILFGENDDAFIRCNFQSLSGELALLIAVINEAAEEDEDVALFYVPLHDVSQRLRIGSLPYNTVYMEALGDQLFFVTEQCDEYSTLHRCTVSFELSETTTLLVFEDKEVLSFSIHQSSPSDIASSLWILLQRWDNLGPYELLKLL